MYVNQNKVIHVPDTRKGTISVFLSDTDKLSQSTMAKIVQQESKIDEIPMVLENHKKSLSWQEQLSPKALVLSAFLFGALMLIPWFCK